MGLAKRHQTSHHLQGTIILCETLRHKRCRDHALTGQVKHISQFPRKRMTRFHSWSVAWLLAHWPLSNPDKHDTTQQRSG